MTNYDIEQARIHGCENWARDDMKAALWEIAIVGAIAFGALVCALSVVLPRIW